MPDTLKNLPLFENLKQMPTPSPHWLEDKLNQLELDTLSPKEALDFLYSLKPQLKNS